MKAAVLAWGTLAVLVTVWWRGGDELPAAEEPAPTPPLPTVVVRMDSLSNSVRPSGDAEPRLDDDVVDDMEDELADLQASYWRMVWRDDRPVLDQLADKWASEWAAQWGAG